MFGDGAGAVLLEPSEDESGLLASHLGCEGEVLEALLVPNFGTAGDRFIEDYHKFNVSFDGREIFRRAVRGMAQEIKLVLSELNMSNDDIDVIMHAFDAYVPDKMSHQPVTFIKGSGADQWIKIDGLVSTKDLLAELEKIQGGGQ